jgi:succinate-semialdehyde dehydrogenase/glutarate-semialdehyde dehydrogenase
MTEFTTINPSTEEALHTYSYTPFTEVAPKLDDSLQSFSLWKNKGFSERAAVLRQTAEILVDRKQVLARLMAKEMGKPFSSGIAEVEKCAWVCRHYAEHAEGYLKPEPLRSDATEAMAVFPPLGPLLAIMPWNFPFWQVLRFSAPALMAGNTILLSHADIVSGCALTLQDIFREAGLPENVFQALIISHETTEQVIRHPAIRAVTLTGSTRAGRKVAAIAGSVLKKSVLELGGSDPYVILEDADVSLAAEACVSSRMINNGETCIAAKRWITTPAVHEAFVQAVVERMEAYTCGDPLEETTRLGPMARKDLRDTLHHLVTRSVEAGARVLCGGKIPDRTGFYYPATVLTDVRPGQPAAEEELFGPVAAIMAAEHESQALDLANQTDFGLGAAVFTRDTERGKRIAAEQLDAGCCFVNTFVTSDPRLPFGGIKNSGYGRELAQWGIREFVNTKTVVVA